MTLRPCLLVLDAEHANSISSRKLVLETAKLNVITAYSCQEAVAELDRFPAVNAIVMNGAISHEPRFPELADAFDRHPSVKVVVVGDHIRGIERFRVDAQVESFAPAQLLDTIQQMFPSEARKLIEHDTRLEERGQ